MRQILLSIFSIALLASVGCGSDPEPCEGPNGPCIEVAASDDATTVQEALLDVQPGDVVMFRAGTYELDRGLSLDVAGVTLRGEGMDESVLSFAGQVDGAQGVLATADDVVIEDLAVEDTPGDGIKIDGATGVTLRRVRVEWTGDPGPENGAYGLYPVQTENVLVEDSVVRGAADAGIYVGQSYTIVVRRNTVEQNVAGIEIENSFDADVFENTATRNTGGILIFNLPGLQVENGARTRVFDNEVYENNWPNFAPEGNIVGKVPQGTGLATIAGHELEVFNNRFADNQTANLGIISFYATETPFEDPEYDPYSDTIYIHDNEFSGGGDRASGELGLALIAALGDLVEAPVVVPDIVFDGISDPEKVDESGELLPDYAVCIQDNGDADYANLDFQNADNGFENAHLDIGKHDCSHDPLPAVTLPGDAG